MMICGKNYNRNTFFKDIKVFLSVSLLVLMVDIFMELIINRIDYKHPDRLDIECIEDISIAGGFILTFLSTVMLFKNRFPFDEKTSCFSSNETRNGAFIVLPTAVYFGLSLLIKYSTDIHHQKPDEPGITRREWADTGITSSLLMIALVLATTVKDSKFCLEKKRTIEDNEGHRVTPTSPLIQA